MEAEIKAVFYAECSALTYSGVDELVEAMALVALHKNIKNLKFKRSKNCSLL